MAAGGKQLGNAFVWIILGLLIAGLAGFGVTNFGGTIRTIGKVGAVQISANDYARALELQLRSLQGQSEQPVQFSQLMDMGLDRTALEQLVQATAVENEVAALGVSIGDDALRRRITELTVFEGVDGNFDRQAYSFSLEQAGLGESEFEENIRAEEARSIVQEAILGAATAPQTMLATLLEYSGARRSFSWMELDETSLPELPSDPAEADLRTYYEENIGEFTIPETRRITYAWLTPEMLVDGIDLDQDEIQRLYESRADEFNQPERRLVERLVFADEVSARSALERIKAGEITFDGLVAERGLALPDIDLGDVTEEDLGEAGAAVFAADIDDVDVVGPHPTPLGAALFRLGGALEAISIPLEEVEDELRDQLARDRAARNIERMAEDINDLLAGGITLEELAEETEMRTHAMDWTDGSRDGISAYVDFRNAAANVSRDDYPEVMFLDDGGIFALRLDEIIDPRPEPFEKVRDRVVEAVEAKLLLEALVAYATEVAKEFSGDGSTAPDQATGKDINEGVAGDEVSGPDTGDDAESLVDRKGDGQMTESGENEPALVDGKDSSPVADSNFDSIINKEVGLTRTAYIEDVPADFMNEIFAMENRGETQVIPGDTTVFLVRLDDILAPEENDSRTAERTGWATYLENSIASDIFRAFSQDALRRAERVIDPRAVDAVNRSFQ